MVYRISVLTYIVERELAMSFTGLGIHGGRALVSLYSVRVRIGVLGSDFMGTSKWRLQNGWSHAARMGIHHERCERAPEIGGKLGRWTDLVTREREKAHDYCSRL